MVKRAEDAGGRAALFEARAAWQRGDSRGAETGCRKALALGQDGADAWVLLGTILRDRDPAGAADALRHAIERDARNPDAPFQLGNLHRQQRQFAAAIEAYERALALAPGHAAVLNNLGLALEAGGETARAAAAWRAALRNDPAHRQAGGNLAHLLCRERNYREAAALCEAHLGRFPDADVAVWIDYGICQLHLGHHAGAEASFRRALTIAPDDAPIVANLGMALTDRGDYEQAEPVFERLLSLAPGELYAAALLADCRQHLCRWDGLAALHAKILRDVEATGEAGPPINPFTALSIPMPPAAQLELARRWARSFAASNPAPPPSRPARAPGPRLRLGYISSDFRQHAIASLLAEVWERHDRSRFETRAYSIGPRETSPLRARIEAGFDHFADCLDDGPDETARRIRDDGIDVLIDLNGYTTHSRTEILARRPAPVQVSWLGYLGTMGADFVDHVITDRFVAPGEAQQFFTERFLYLPGCYCPSDTRRTVAPDAGSRPVHGLPADGFVFCCFNNVYKLLPVVFDVWMRLLDGVPGSVLWLSPGDVAASENLRREAARRGVDPDRLVFAPRVPLPDHLARHAHADLFLDTFPYNAGTMANDALFMGLPVLTCAGSTMASRVAGSQLRAAGLPELVTWSLGDYESLALQMARDTSLLAGCRQRLRENRTTAALFDMPRFTADLEAALLRTVPGQTGRPASA